MDTVLKIVILLLAIVYLSFILLSVKKRKIDLNYSLIWIFLGILMLIFAIIPNLIEVLSTFLGFKEATSMLFFFSIIMIFLIIFNLTAIVTNQSKKIIKLVQEISILSKKVEEIENNNKNKGR